MLKQYIRNKKNNPIGVLLADKIDNDIQLGFSLCSKRDTYNKEKGMQIALHRLHHKGVLNIPDSINELVDAFELRAAKYFKIAVVQEE